MEIKYCFRNWYTTITESTRTQHLIALKSIRRSPRQVPGNPIVHTTRCRRPLQNDAPGTGRVAFFVPVRFAGVLTCFQRSFKAVSPSFIVTVNRDFRCRTRVQTAREYRRNRQTTTNTTTTDSTAANDDNGISNTPPTKWLCTLFGHNICFDQTRIQCYPTTVFDLTVRPV